MEAILEWLESEGYDERNDPELYEYLQRWLTNNQFMVMEDPVALFQTSAGVEEYKATGHVTPEDD